VQGEGEEGGEEGEEGGEEGEGGEGEKGGEEGEEEGEGEGEEGEGEGEEGEGEGEGEREGEGEGIQNTVSIHTQHTHKACTQISVGMNLVCNFFRRASSIRHISHYTILHTSHYTILHTSHYTILHTSHYTILHTSHYITSLPTGCGRTVAGSGAEVRRRYRFSRPMHVPLMAIASKSSAPCRLKTGPTWRIV
jgi:hypothetical protein